MFERDFDDYELAGCMGLNNTIMTSESLSMQEGRRNPDGDKSESAQEEQPTIDIAPTPFLIRNLTKLKMLRLRNLSKKQKRGKVNRLKLAEDL